MLNTSPNERFHGSRAKIISVNNRYSRFIISSVIIAKLRIFSEAHKLEENFKVIDAEDAAVADSAALAGGKQLDVAPTSVKGIAQRYDVAEFEYRAVGFPHGNIDWVAGVEHCSGC